MTYPEKVNTPNGSGVLIGKTKDGYYIVRHPNCPEFDESKCVKVLAGPGAVFGPLAVYESLSE